MAKLDEQRNSSRAKAEALLTRKKQQETERVANRDRDSRVQDEKTARLRALRLAKEAEEKRKRRNRAERKPKQKSPFHNDPHCTFSVIPVAAP